MSGPRVQRPFDVQVKLLMVGDSAVGKTCLLLRYATDSFAHTFITTIGIDFKVKHLTLDDGTRVKMQMWDTAGQERFRTITTSYFRGAQGVMLLYDVTARDTFENVVTWLHHIRAHADAHVTLVLIGNKCDLVGDRQVSYEEGSKVAAEHDMLFMETSAAANTNVTHAFTQVAGMVAKRLLSAGAGAGGATRPSIKLGVSTAVKQETSGCGSCVV